MPVSIRPSTQDDASLIVGLASEFTEYLRSLGDPEPGDFSAQQYLEDGCGPTRAFSGLIADLDNEPVGYLFYCPGYDLDLGGRILWIVDLFVTQSARGHGVARSLMQAAAQICRESGGNCLSWSVYIPNKLGLCFYEHMGAEYTRDLMFMHWQIPDS